MVTVTVIFVFTKRGGGSVLFVWAHARVRGQPP